MKYFKMIITGMMMLFMGCATMEQDLFVKEEYKKQIIQSAKVNISKVMASTEDGRLLVKGHVRKRHPGVGIVPKSITVDLIDANGKLYDSKKVSYFPKNFSSRKRFQFALFTAEFSTMPLPGSTIQIACID